MGCWYRPPDPGEIASITALKTELMQHRRHAIGIVIMTDANVHNERWLRHSSGHSAEGTELRNVCYDLNLEQRVSKPARGEYRLDLVLTDVPRLHVSVLPKIADHNIVLASLEISTPTTSWRTFCLGFWRG